MTEADCQECAGPIHTPVQDAEAVAWLGKSAPTFCSQACWDCAEQRAINAAGNES